jgi:hypothetical protein
MIELLKKIIHSKLTDQQFKLMFLISFIFNFGGILLLILFGTGLLKQYEYHTNNQKIVILDETGNQYIKTAIETQKETFSNLGTKLIKEITSFDYEEKDRIFELIKTFTTVESYSQYEKFILDNKWMDDTDLLHGVYKSKVNQARIINLNSEEYIVFYSLQVYFNSETKKKEFPLFVKIKMVKGLPTKENIIGTFISDIYYTTNQEEYQKEIEKDE